MTNEMKKRSGKLFEYDEDLGVWVEVAQGRLSYMMFLAEQLQKASGRLVQLQGDQGLVRFYMGTIKHRVNDQQLKEILGLPKGVK